jgi:hypothetical protein
MKAVCTFLILCAMVFPLNVRGVELKATKAFGGDDIYNAEQILISGSEIFVRDRGDETIKVFSGDGVLKTKFGGKGSGPGEIHYAIWLAITNEKIYIIDTGQVKIHVFQKEKKKFLYFKKILPWLFEFGPNSFFVTDDETFYFARNVVINNDKVIMKMNKDLELKASFLDCINGFKNRDEFMRLKSMLPEIFMNLGYIQVSGKKVYFAYYLINKVIEFSDDGKRLNDYTLPIPSMEKTAKVITFADGSADLESRLNYDLKIKNGRILVLSRNEKGISIVFELKDGVFKEIYRMNDPLLGFDILDNKLYGLYEGEKGILVYNLKNK